jgi:hypothetical protein
VTRAQAAAKAATKGTLPHKTCATKLGKDRCTLIEGHKGKWHQAIGPTGVRIRWARAFVSPIRGFIG